MSTTDPAKRLSRRLRTAISTTPALYFPLARRKKGDFLVSPDTKIVIEGYPRSGNSFAEAAFRVANGRDFRIAHHCHAPAQVIAGARRGLPTLVVLRDPLGAGTSLMMHHPGLFTPADVLREYWIFHEAIEPVRDRIVLASFGAVTKDFGAVIQAVNARYGTNFTPFVADKASTAAAFELLDTLSRERGTVKDGLEPYSPKRTDEERARRAAEQDAIRQQLMAQDLASLRNRCQAVFERLNATCDL